MTAEIASDGQSRAASAGAVSWAAVRLREEGIPRRDPQEYPWRRVRTPYRVFLAEFLLVRTRTDVVARIFEDVVAGYPDVEALADTDEETLATFLAPLGLRKRVPLLLKAARYLVERHNGHIPENIKDLEAVPGLGPYSAAAIATFAYGAAVVPADVNILRFVSRLTGLPMTHPTKGSKELCALLPLLSPEEGGPKFDELLDFTRLTCRPGRPRCSECPVRDRCRYFATAQSQEFAP